MKTHVLDANALFRYLLRDPGFETVHQALKDASISQSAVLMSAINWGEVYYTMIRKEGAKIAATRIEQLSQLPLSIVAADRGEAKAAAELKAAYGLHYADCFAAALTGKHGVLVTADTKDFKRIPWLQISALPPFRS